MKKKRMPKLRTINLKSCVPKKIHQKLRELAVHEEVSLQGYIVSVLEDFINQLQAVK